MGIYYAVLGVITALGIPLCCLKRAGIGPQEERRQARIKNAVFLLACFLILGGLSAFRYSVGFDYSYIYAPNYEPILKDPLGPYNRRFEKGFVLLERIIALCSKNYQMLFIVTSFLMVGLFMLYYWLNSPNVFYSVFLFIILNHYYCSMDFIRQTIAGLIAVFAIPFLKKRKLIPYLLLVLLASTFHVSALILIPSYFINLIPINKWVLAVYAVVTGIIYFNTERIMNFVTQYVYKSYNAESVHVTTAFPIVFTLAVLCVFLVVFLGSRFLTKKDPRNYVYVNYAFFTLFFVLMGTKHSILDRLSLYFELAGAVSVPIVLQGLREEFPSLRAALREKSAHIRLCALSWTAILALMFGGGLAFHQYSLTRDHHGVVPYNFIYDQSFYRPYLDSLKQNKEVSSGEAMAPSEEASDILSIEPVQMEPVDGPRPDPVSQSEILPQPEEPSDSVISGEPAELGADGLPLEAPKPRKSN